MIRESEYNAEVIGTKFNKPLAKAKKIMKFLKVLLNAVFVKEHVKKVK